MRPLPVDIWPLLIPLGVLLVTAGLIVSVGLILLWLAEHYGEEWSVAVALLMALAVLGGGAYLANRSDGNAEGQAQSSGH